MHFYSGWLLLVTKCFYIGLLPISLQWNIWIHPPPLTTERTPDILTESLADPRCSGIIPHNGAKFLRLIPPRINPRSRRRFPNTISLFLSGVFTDAPLIWKSLRVRTAKLSLHTHDRDNTLDLIPLRKLFVSPHALWLYNRWNDDVSHCLTESYLFWIQPKPISSFYALFPKFSLTHLRLNLT